MRVASDRPLLALALESLPLPEGLFVAAYLSPEKAPEAKGPALLLLPYPKPYWVLKALEKGYGACIHETAPLEEILQVGQAVKAGWRMPTPSVPKLTLEELRTLETLASVGVEKRAAQLLGISYDTLKERIAALKRKTGARRMADLMIGAHQLGYL